MREDFGISQELTDIDRLSKYELRFHVLVTKEIYLIKERLFDKVDKISSRTLRNCKKE